MKRVVGTKQGREGSVLFLSTVYLFIVTAVAVTFISALHRSHSLQSRLDRTEQAYQLAEAGIEKAVAELNSDRGYRGEADTPLGNGRFSVTVMPLEQAGRYQIESNARLLNDSTRGSRVTLRAEFALGVPGQTESRQYARSVAR